MKKINNKILLIGLLLLIGLFVVSRLFRSPQLESNLRKELVKLDTAKVTEVRVTSSGEDRKTVKLTRENKTWIVTSDDKKYKVDVNAIKGLLNGVGSVQAERMVSRKKEKWESFSVDDKATVVSVYYGSDKEAEFHIGKTGFNQPPGGGNPMSGGNFSPYTYVRLSDEDEVYIVNGFLGSTFNRALNDWRDKSLLRVPRDLVTKVSFNYPDSGFVAVKQDSIWTTGTQTADLNKMSSYLGMLSYRNANTFADDFQSTAPADVTIQVEGAGNELSTIEGWRRENQWIIRSSLQPDVFFSEDAADVFIGQTKLLP